MIKGGDGLITATVPKIAPLAPMEGKPTSAKLPPSTFLHIIKVNRKSLTSTKLNTPKYTSRKVGYKEATRSHLSFDLKNVKSHTG